MEVPTVDLNLLNTVFSRLAIRGIRYHWGTKIALGLDTSDPSIDEGVDCSGFVRYALSKATRGALDITDGSASQHNWCRNADLHKLARYADVTQADPSRLFIAFINPDPGEHPGHVWLVHRAESAGKDWQQEVPTTMESYGGVGVGSRHWNARVLLRQVSECFELPAI